jgi:dTMP kinase
MSMKKIRGLGRGLRYPGRLIVVEGCDGSGKSTQLHLARVWLEQMGYPVFYTEWNSSDIVTTATRRAKKKNLLTPTTFSLIHACDFADRYEKVMLPPLRAGYIVLADRYVYTAYARDVARGCDPDWVRNLYSFAVRPTLAFYFQAPLEVSVGRILVGRPVLKYHEAGMDLGLSTDPVESFKLFQGTIKSEYDRMAKKEKLVVIDSTRAIHVVQQDVRDIVRAAMHGYEAPSESAPARGSRVGAVDLDALRDGEERREGTETSAPEEDDLATFVTPTAPVGSRGSAKRGRARQVARSGR